MLQGVRRGGGTDVTEGRKEKRGISLSRCHIIESQGFVCVWYECCAKVPLQIATRERGLTRQLQKRGDTWL